MADTIQPESGFHAAKGEWPPPYAPRFIPLFCWPLRPIQALKWLFSGGSLWSWDLFFVLTAAVTWLWLQPPLSRCVEFRWGWIGPIHFVNLSLLWLAGCSKIDYRTLIDFELFAVEWPLPLQGPFMSSPNQAYVPAQ